MKKFISISFISIFGILFYGCGTIYKTETVYVTDSVTGKVTKKVIKYYDTTPNYYNNTYVSPYPYYGNPYYWYGGWGAGYYGWNNNVYVIRPTQPSPAPRPMPIRPSYGVPGHVRGRN